MPDKQPNFFEEWMRNVNEKLKEVNLLRIDHEKLKTEMRTRNRIVWALVAIMLAASAIGLVNFILKHLGG